MLSQAQRAQDPRPQRHTTRIKSSAYTVCLMGLCKKDFYFANMVIVNTVKVIQIMKTRCYGECEFEDFVGFQFNHQDKFTAKSRNELARKMILSMATNLLLEYVSAGALRNELIMTKLGAS